MAELIMHFEAGALKSTRTTMFHAALFQVTRFLAMCASSPTLASRKLYWGFLFIVIYVRREHFLVFGFSSFLSPTFPLRYRNLWRFSTAKLESKGAVTKKDAWNCMSHRTTLRDKANGGEVQQACYRRAKPPAGQE